MYDVKMTAAKISSSGTEKPPNVKKQAWIDSEPDTPYSDMDDEQLTRSFRHFSTHTTLHGLRYSFGGGKKSIVRRGVWLFVLLLSFAFLVREIALAVMEYSAHLSMMTTSEVLEHRLVLPAVTVCNINKYKASRIHSLYPHVEGSFRSWAAMLYGEEPINITRFDQEMNTSAVHDSYIGIYDTMHQLGDVYLRCKIGSVLLNCSDFTTPSYTDKGLCYTFNSMDMIGRGPLTVNKQGHMTAIQLTLDVQPDDYFIPLNYGTGLLLSIHDQHEKVPFLEDRNIVIPPGQDIYIALLKTERTKLGGRYSTQDCKESQFDTLGECTNNCKIRNALECRKCNAGSKSIEENPNLCTFKQVFDCSLKNIPRWYNGDFSCNCPLNCKKTIFEHKISYAAFPSDLALEDARRLNWTHRDKESIAANYANVNIYFEDLKTIYKAQTPVINQWQLFSSLGGLMGLAMGTSLMTILEFLDFAVVSMFVRCRKRHKRGLQVGDCAGGDVSEEGDCDSVSTSTYVEKLPI